MPRTSRKTSAAVAEAFQVRAELLGTRPPVWWRLLIRSDITLAELHDVLQTAFDWTNSHLHQFEDKEGTYYSDPTHGLDDVEDETRVRLRDLLVKEKDRCTYMYDFGDSWEHGIELQKRLPADKAPPHPICLAGKNAAPPDDCGGIWGYYEMLDAIRDPKHENHDDMIDWLGGDFDPTAFDLESINRRLRRL